VSHVSETAAIGEGTVLGRFCVVEDGARIGRDCVLGHHVVVHAGTEIGNGVRIDDHAVLGKQPMRAAASATTRRGAQPPASVGDDCIIGTGAVVYAGAALGRKVLVADLATIREEVTVGDFTIVGRGAAIENRCTIGRHCKIETNAYITAFSTLEDRVFVAPCVVTTNDNFVGRTEQRFACFKGVTVRRGGRIGAGATVLPGREIGEDALVAAGAVLTRDAPPRRVVLGFPARDVRPVPEEQILERQGWKE
jgi:UDP-2-acetamido-3-amino-2,3-dideoxy-glucuronate N-acetyltransferase